MHHQNPVPLHLQQPLFIDTDINYSLDMSKFPGLDDPQYMYEPALLIAKQTEHYGRESISTNVNSTKGYCTRSPNAHHMTSYKTETPKDELEELLNIIDSCSAELLERLGTKEQEPNKGLTGSIQDSPGRTGVLSTKATASVPIQYYSKRNETSSSNFDSLKDYHNPAPFRVPSGSGTWGSVRNSNTGYNVSTSHVCSKRKRVEEVPDVPVYKRQCYGMNSSNWFGASGVHSHNVPVFKEISSHRSFGLSY